MRVLLCLVLALVVGLALDAFVDSSAGAWIAAGAVTVICVGWLIQALPGGGGGDLPSGD